MKMLNENGISNKWQNILYLFRLYYDCSALVFNFNFQISHPNNHGKITASIEE